MVERTWSVSLSSQYTYGCKSLQPISSDPHVSSYNGLESLDSFLSAGLGPHAGAGAYNMRDNYIMLYRLFNEYTLGAGTGSAVTSN